jgi:hypothetical protein
MYMGAGLKSSNDRTNDNASKDLMIMKMGKGEKKMDKKVV